MDKGKQIMLKTGIIFAVFVLFLLFFSKTIYEYNLPAVSVAFPSSGKITISERAEGKVYLDGEIDIVAQVSGRIELHVEKGQYIYEGDSLYAVQSDIEAIEDSLESAVYNRDTISLKISKLQNDIAYYSQNLNAKRDADIDALDLSSYDREVKRAEAALETALSELENMQVLYDIGAVSLNELNEKQEIYRDLQLDYDKAMNDRQKAIDDYNKSTENKLTEHEDDIKYSQKNITDLNYQLNEARLELDYVNRQITDLNNQLNNGGLRTVYADHSGITRDISDNAKSGRYIDKNMVLMSVQPFEAGCRAVFEFKDELDYVAKGSEVELTIKSKNLRNIPGVVDDLYYEDETYYIVVAFAADGISGGESVSTVFKYESDTYQMILPNSAVREDVNANYILYVDQVRTSFGWDYVARRMYCSPVENDHMNTAVLIGGYDGQAIIVNSNMPVFEDAKVKIASGSDAVETR